MSDVESRLTDLELRYMRQQELLEALNGELTEANQSLTRMTKRVERLERQVESLLHALDKPANEKPPHY